MLTLMQLDSLHSELDTIEYHFLRSYSMPTKNKQSSLESKINPLQEELLEYKKELNEYIKLTDSKLLDLEKEYQILSTKLNGSNSYDSEEEFLDDSFYETTIEEEAMMQNDSKNRHITQTFTNTYQLFEGTLRQLVQYYKDTTGVKIKVKNKNKDKSKNSDGRELFESYMSSLGKFPKNNTEWKRINNIYSLLHDVIKHNDSELPDVKFGKTVILNFDERRSKKLGESIIKEKYKTEKIVLTQSLVNEFIDNLISFSGEKQFQEEINEFYEKKGALEKPTTLDCYKAFNDMFHSFENYIIKTITRFETFQSVNQPINSINSTGVNTILTYMESNNLFSNTKNNVYFQKILNSYKTLNHRRGKR